MAGKKVGGADTQAPEMQNTPDAGKKVGGTKVYNFTSTNKYLSCNALGVQFVDGKASTTNLEVAKALVKIEGVKLVEE